MEGFDILMLARATWGVTTSIAENTARILAKKNRILVVEPLTALSTLIRESRLQKRRWTTKHGVRQLGDRIWVYTPPALGLPGHTRWKMVTDFNAWTCAHLVRREMRRMKMRRPIVWSYGYNTGKLIQRLNGQLSIYDCGENYEALARDDQHRQLVKRYEIETCQATDLVFACSELLGETRRLYNPATYEVYCAADLEFFGRSLLSETTVPTDLSSLPKPIIGYQGGCDPFRINLDLVRHIALAHPEWTLAFVGYMWFGFDQSPLADLPNVHFLGTKPYSDFPGYLKGMDVCIAPFNSNELTRFGDMLKIYEYLASGRPVVSTTNPAACRVREAIRIADSPTEFVQAIEASLLDSSESRQRRLSVVQAHSWEKRVEQKWSLIRRHLPAT